MPIDPKKFKKIVNNHFDNLSEEEFLKTLHKSSPYLFDESSEEKQDTQQNFFDESSGENQATWQINQIEIPLDSSSQIKITRRISHHPNQEKYFDRKKSFWYRGIVMTGTIFIVFFTGSFLATIYKPKQSSASQVFTSKDKFQCNVNGNGVVVLSVKIGTVSRPFIKFVDDFTGYSKIDRCKTISNNFTKYTEQSGLYVSTSIRNGHSILCASDKNGKCIEDDNGGKLLSFSPSTDPKRSLKLLSELNHNNSLEASPIFTQSKDVIYLKVGE
jgi:Circadian oscillating protein COP23